MKMSVLIAVSLAASLGEECAKAGLAALEGR